MSYGPYPSDTAESVHGKQTDKIYQQLLVRQGAKADRVAGLRTAPVFKEYKPPVATHRKTIDVAEGVQVRSFYDGKLA